MRTAITIVLMLALTATYGCHSKSSSARGVATPGSAQSYRQADFVGARGPEGPTGAKGMQGPTGQTGAPGYAMAGPRGQEGATGTMGEQGRTGARGPAGNLAVGPTGVAGPAGAQGAQGPIGQTGVRGDSADGYAGPTGSTGRTGTQGLAGATGAKGSTLVGPSGPAGRSGATGEQGERGMTGAQGSTMAGVAGPTGTAGATGPQGPIGPTGPQGPTGVIQYWTSYRDFWFDAEKAAIHDADWHIVAEIAAYMKDNPSLQLGIDGSTNPRATQWRDQNLCDRRVSAIRDSLISAGVPAYRISEGMFGDVRFRRNGRVEVLLRTPQLSQAK
jgi:outer membrane protein OmpA-like peptidoglycan-associated protein